MKKILLALLLGTFCLSASAQDTYYVPDSENPVFQFNVVYPGESPEELQGDTSDFVIPYDYVLPILISGENWAEKLNLSPVPPTIYFYKSQDFKNASAQSPYFMVEGKPYKYTMVNATLHNWIDTGGETVGSGTITIGTGLSDEYPGWGIFDNKHALYHGTVPDLFVAMNHEIMHSLGVTSAVYKYNEGQGDNKFYFSESTTEPLSIYDSQLRIYTGTSNPVADPTHELAPSMGQAVGMETGEYNLVDYSPYFAGENTIKVLGGDNNPTTAKNNIVTNGGLINYSRSYEDASNRPVVYGMPIHPDDDGDYDLSHLELRNSYMSHQRYRNWLTPMEAELAVMNDIGYNIDLRKYFGQSYYLNGQDLEHQTTYTYNKGFSMWDGTSYTGTPSPIDQAVGIHIYGNYNNVTQTTNDIKTMGEGSFGVRVDGVGNTYTLASGNINADGTENIGIGVTWGKNHVINIDSGTQVTATGKDGIATSFDFGSNMFGLAVKYFKGSYINYIKDGDKTPDLDNQGELITDFNVNGTLTGSKAAIYISENAHVKNINVGNGAQINGNITSEWNSISYLDKAAVQVDETKYTNLNFNSNAGVDVNGNITGKNEMQNTLKMNNAANSVVNFNGEEINVNSLDNKGDINISQNAIIATVNNTITGDGNLNVLSGASLGLSSNITNIENAVGLDRATLNTANDSIGTTTFSNLTLSGDNLMKVDMDIASQTADTLNFNNPADLTVNPGARLKISNVNMMNTNKAYTNEEYSIPFISSANNNQKLLGAVALANQPTVLTPIFKYNLGYTEDNTQGGFLFSRGTTKDYNSYNPAVVTSSVAAQFGGYLNQLNSYDQAFQNLDMKMLMTREEREALKMANTYASTVTPKVFSNIYLPEKDSAGWFRPYATFEKVGLDNGPKVENISYGSYFGGDSPMYTTKNGWDYQYSVYAGYNGSHQNYTGNSIYQNGGTLGATGIWYKGDFFTALTANVGAGVADASTMYGSEDMTMLMTGIASKTGYNWELSKGKFIIQPSYLMSYSFVNTFDYTNAAGLRIKSDPLNAINIAPGLKFIGNLKNGWQPYASVQMVWNIMDKTDFRANDVALPDMSVKPYVQYGVGIQKRWGDRFTGFFQTMLRNGGRNGVALSFGFRWTLGK